MSAILKQSILLSDKFSGRCQKALIADDLADYYYVESQGIYIGYKYYETRYEDQILGRGNAVAAEGSVNGKACNYADEVSYPFGYGMSYTSFSQELESVDVQIGGTSTALVKVTNTGNTAGKDVAELYVQAPYTEGGLEKASVQLVGFGKTDLLEPGASQELTIEFDARYFASYDEAISASNAVLWTLDETDSETYSAGVQNAMQDADLNRLIPGSVEYTTRSDWSKGWQEVAQLTATEEMLPTLKNVSRQLAANDDYEIVWGADNGLTLADMIRFGDDGSYQGAVDIDDPLWDELIQEVTLDEAINFLENCTDEFDAIDSIGIGNVYNNDGPIGFVNDQVSGYAAKWDPSMSSEPTYVGPDDPYAKWTLASMPTEPIVAATFNLELIQNIQKTEAVSSRLLFNDMSDIIRRKKWKKLKAPILATGWSWKSGWNRSFSRIQEQRMRPGWSERWIRQNWQRE